MGLSGLAVKESPRIAIIGAGAGGLCMAIRLRNAGIRSFTVFEKADGVGGTWRDNTYPGAACDIPSHLYSLSFAPKADWSRKFPCQPEILEYFESLVDRFDLGPHLQLGTEATELSWDDTRQEWILSLLRDGKLETSYFDLVVSALGQLNQPYIPALDGLDSFEGTTFHSARWDHGHDLRGERVAVVGIGASAIQFVPQIAKQARTLTLFQRSVNYVVPKPDRAFRKWENWILANVPAVAKLYRESIYWRFEARFGLMRKGSRLGRLVQRRFSEQVEKLETPELRREALVPDYSPGCRRLLIANDWYPTLLRPNVRVVTEPIEMVTPRGLVDAAGTQHQVDTIIFGTGFRSTEFLTPMKVFGRAGRDLNEVWKDGARALLGLSVPEFPNFFMLYGPNTNLGHNSILFMIEQQVGYILQLIDKMRSGGVTTIEVTDAAMARFEGDIESAAARTVWSEDCSSWYKNASGRITNNWPDYTVKYRRLMRHPDPKDWTFQAIPRPDSALL